MIEVLAKNTFIHQVMEPTHNVLSLHEKHNIHGMSVKQENLCSSKPGKNYKDSHKILKNWTRRLPRLNFFQKKPLPLVSRPFISSNRPPSCMRFISKCNCLSDIQKKVWFWRVTGKSFFPFQGTAITISDLPGQFYKYINLG